MTDNQDFPLPKLNPLIELFRSEDHKHGTPRWTVYHPLTHTYYRIEWPEFECLARFHRCKSAKELVDMVNTETTVTITIEDVHRLSGFLAQHELIILPLSKRQRPQKPSIWLKALKTYLFFTIPLVRPQRFLKKTLPYIRPLMNGSLHKIILMLFGLLILLTLPRADEFFATFPQLLTWEGAALGLILFACIKICHELAHAYTATYYDIPISHMGIALIVLYPVLYTEATGSWRLNSAKKRMSIGLAGIIAELYIATFFLALWHLSAPGMLQTISFTIVAITFIGSVLINLNPLMRFDGYYVLSDRLGYENLQDRSLAFARWALRRTLFGLKDSLPEELPPKDRKFMVFFGVSLLIYRFFLFLGIALLVYVLFFKPLGLILMLIELWWFIGRPVFNEIKIWFKRYKELLQTRRTQIILGGSCLVFLYLLLPLQTHITLPAIMVPENYQTYYAPLSAKIDRLYVTPAQAVKKGEVLAALSSQTLLHDISIKKAQQTALQQQVRSLRFSSSEKALLLSAETQLQEVAIELEQLKNEEQKLLMTAPFDGIIHDLEPDIHEGRSIEKNKMMFRIIKQGSAKFIAYASERQKELLTLNQQALFQSSALLNGRHPLIIETIQPLPADHLPWPELASLYGGPIAADPAYAPSSYTSKPDLIPRTTIFPVILRASSFTNTRPENIQTGSVFIKIPGFSLVKNWGARLILFLQNELSLNNEKG